MGILLALGALVVYAWSNPDHLNQYAHFVWQADAFLHGRAWIPFPVEGTATQPGNDYYQDLYPVLDAAGNETGRVLLPFPPLPALVLVPFVAVFGLATDQEGISLLLATLGVGLAWWMLGRLPIGGAARTLITVLFALGSVWWWSAAVGSTWYFAHLVAVNLALLSVGVALGADPRASEEDPWDEADRVAASAHSSGRAPQGRLRRAVGLWWPLDRSQLLAGFLLGLATTARLPLVFAAPFLVMVGGGGSWQRRTLSAAAGGALPVAALLAYTFITTGSPLHPGYDFQYQREAYGYPSLGYHPEWSAEDLRYVPQNVGIMLGGIPAILPDIKPDTLGFNEPEPLCTNPGIGRGLFDPDCPLAMPRDIGTSILLTSPAFLLAAWPLLRRTWARLTVGATAAVLAIALFNLAHFSQGWVQWGYRFSNDFIPFLLPLVALGASRADGRPRIIALALVVAGIAVNAWGVAWGQILGW